MLADASRTVVLSPHLDDAAVAVGAYLARRSDTGASTEVITVYTSGPDLATLPDRMRVFGDYRARVLENDSAMAILGADIDNLGLHERIFRDPRLSRLTEVFRTPSSVDGFRELAHLTGTVEALLADPDVEVLAPIGVGNHVDHVEVSVAVMTAAARCGGYDRVWFYEDFYALSAVARRRHPVTAGARQPIADAPVWRSPLAGLRLEAAAVLARGPSSTELFGGAVSWTSEIAESDAIERKLEAIGEYRSQTAALGGMDALRTMIRCTHRTVGGEVLWQMRPTVSHP